MDHDSLYDILPDLPSVPELAAMSQEGNCVHTLPPPFHFTLLACAARNAAVGDLLRGKEITVSLRRYSDKLELNLNVSINL